MCIALLSVRSLLHPFAWVSEGGRIDVGRDVALKKVRLDAGNGLIEIGDSVWLNDGVELSVSSKISIGMGTSIQRNSTVNGDVLIGRECLLAPNVFISSGTHAHDYMPGKSIREQERMIPRDEFAARYNKPVIIGDDVWIGANAVVMPGVSIGSHAIIGANAVVTSDVAVGAIMGGVPAKLLRIRSGFEGI
jgi:acetyltransferase-like isoleucine patch superfamily enzyme